MKIFALMRINDYRLMTTIDIFNKDTWDRT